MPFLKLQIKLTSEQIEALAPIQAAIQNTKPAGTVLGEIVVHEKDWRYPTVSAYFLDHPASEIVSKALIAAQDDFDRRKAKAARLTSLQALFQGDADVEDGILVIKRDKFRYEVREIEIEG